MPLLVVATSAIAACGPAVGRVPPMPSAATTASTSPPQAPWVPAALVDPRLALDAPAVPVPLELRIPSLGLVAPVSGVGQTAKQVMDAPQGAPGDLVWQQAFWYRGGSVPGALGTATIAGHVDDVLGRDALFARLKDLGPGQEVVVHDTRADLDVRFTVTERRSYSTREFNDPVLLRRVYGTGPVDGLGPQPAPDGTSHLVLITCSGDYVNQGFDHRLVVYAQRSG